MNILERKPKTNPDGTVSIGKSGINHALSLEISKEYAEAKKKCQEARNKRNELS